LCVNFKNKNTISCKYLKKNKSSSPTSKSPGSASFEHRPDSEWELCSHALSTLCGDCHAGCKVLGTCCSSARKTQVLCWWSSSFTAMQEPAGVGGEIREAFILWMAWREYGPNWIPQGWLPIGRASLSESTFGI
jgi:hypothetical protein